MAFSNQRTADIHGARHATATWNGSGNNYNIIDLYMITHFVLFWNLMNQWGHTYAHVTTTWPNMWESVAWSEYHPSCETEHGSHYMRIFIWTAPTPLQIWTPTAAFYTIGSIPLYNSEHSIIFGCFTFSWNMINGISLQAPCFMINIDGQRCVVDFVQNNGSSFDVYLSIHLTGIYTATGFGMSYVNS